MISLDEYRFSRLWGIGSLGLGYLNLREFFWLEFEMFFFISSQFGSIIKILVNDILIIFRSVMDPG